MTKKRTSNSSISSQSLNQSLGAEAQVSGSVATDPSKETIKSSNAKPSTTKPSTAEPAQTPKELNGPKGLEPTRYGDWESKGRCCDF